MTVEIFSFELEDHKKKQLYDIIFGEIIFSYVHISGEQILSWSTSNISDVGHNFQWVHESSVAKMRLQQSNLDKLSMFQCIKNMLEKSETTLKSNCAEQINRQETFIFIWSRVTFVVMATQIKTVNFNCLDLRNNATCLDLVQ